jgi:hypothetical protein
MRVVVVFKDETDYARPVLDFLHDFEHQTGHSLEVVDPETPDGIQFCETYDLVEYPTVVALSDDSRMLNMWRGLPLPTISEVSYYVQ